MIKMSLCSLPRLSVLAALVLVLGCSDPPPVDVASLFTTEDTTTDSINQSASPDTLSRILTCLEYALDATTVMLSDGAEYTERVSLANVKPISSVEIEAVLFIEREFGGCDLTATFAGPGATVTRKSNGASLNIALVRAGLAAAGEDPAFLAAERDAREDGLGAWEGLKERLPRQRPSRQEIPVEDSPVRVVQQRGGALTAGDADSVSAGSSRLAPPPRDDASTWVYLDQYDYHMDSNCPELKKRIIGPLRTRVSLAEAKSKTFKMACKRCVH
jgi:hypothetical protein